MELRKNADLAEFIGILLGDGSIGRYESRIGNSTKTQYRVKVTGDASEDLPYFKDFLVPLLERIFNKKPKLRFKKGERTVELLLFGPKIFTSLIEIGIVEAPKKKRAVIPDFIGDKNLQKEFLRGFFDTDGCVVFDKQHKDKHYYPRLEMKIDDTPMRNQIIEMLTSLEFGPITSPQKGGIWRVQINGKTKYMRWVNEIGFNNAKHLTKHLFCQKFGYYMPGVTLQDRYKSLRGNTCSIVARTRKSSLLGLSSQECSSDAPKRNLGAGVAHKSLSS